MKPPSPEVLRRLCFLWGGFLLVIIALANTDGAPALFAWVDHRLPGRDFTGHVVLMGILSLLVNLALGARRVRRWPSPGEPGRTLPLLLGSVALAAVVTLEECSQLFLIHRNFSWVDLSADLLGIFVCGRLAAWWVSRSA